MDAFAAFVKAKETFASCKQIQDAFFEYGQFLVLMDDAGKLLE